MSWLDWLLRRAPTPDPVADPAPEPIDRAQANVDAFLFTLRACEGTSLPTGWTTLFGGGQFSGYADHPRIRFYEKYDGQFVANGKLDYTTAAGAFQITATTWDDFIKAQGPHRFDPDGQTACAMWLINARCHALGAIKEGRLLDAMKLCAGTWASLPASTVGQPTRTYAFASGVYANAGGALA